MQKLLAVLLDVDGTLVDSNDAHARAWLQAMAEFGVGGDFTTVRRLIGKGGDKLLPEAAGIDAESEKGKAISKRRGEIFKSEFLPTLSPFPGVKELLAHMQAVGLRLAVASSAKKDELRDLLRVCGADKFIEVSTSSDDAEESKPDPDIIHAALEQVAVSADKAILLGDTPYDVEAATRAGVKAVALRCGGWLDADLRGAMAIYDSPADLLAHFEGSPFEPNEKV